MFFQYCSIGLSSGEYGGRRIILIPWVATSFITSLERCQRPLSTMMQSLGWCFFNLLRNARNFFELIFGLGFVIVNPLPNAPKTWIFWDLLSTYLIVGRDPLGYQPLMMCGSSLNVASSRNKISYPRFLRTLSLRQSFF